MIRGSCLCGGVRFELDRTTGPFELCHCNRCRKVSGSAYVAALLAKAEDFRLVEGKDLIRTYEAPIIEAPPAYLTDHLPQMTKQQIARSRAAPLLLSAKETPW